MFSCCTSLRLGVLLCCVLGGALAGVMCHNIIILSLCLLLPCDGLAECGHVQALTSSLSLHSLWQSYSIRLGKVTERVRLHTHA